VKLLGVKRLAWNEFFSDCRSPGEVIEFHCGFEVVLTWEKGQKLD
jgi:hypothetical protein